jgi:signal transduction histidine kinase
LGHRNADAGEGMNAAAVSRKLHLKTEYGVVAALRREPRTAGSWRRAGRSPIGLRVCWLHVVVAFSVATLAIAFAYPAADQDPALRAALETLVLLFGLTAAVSFRAQFVRTRRGRDLLLFASLLLLALIELFTYFVPAVLDLDSGGGFAAAGLWGKLLVAGAFALAAFTPRGRLIAGGRRPLAITVAAAGAAIGVAELLAQLLRNGVLPPSIHPVFGFVAAVRYPLAVAAVLCTAGLLVYAAIGFVRAARHERDAAFSLLAGACIFEAATQLYYFPLPWLAPDWIAPGEGLRLVAFALVLAAGIRRELWTRAAIATAAATAERRRVAQDLHDGLAQDLALIVAHSSQIATELGREHPVTVAARRALAVSRGTIGELSDPAGATTEEALEAVAHELRDRFGIEIAVHCELDFEPAPDTREQITRIVREAIANAARHGRAKHVFVSLHRTVDGVALRVSDDGCGIASTVHDGFGLGNMRERAATLGGYMTVRPARRRGTELEVVLP